MRLRLRPSMWTVPLLLSSALLFVVSCAPAQVGPRAWIDWPRDGYRIAPGTTLSLICHAYAERGVAEVRLEVDRQPYRVASPDLPGEQFVEASIDWFADEPGTYLLSVVAFDVNGQASNPASVTVSVSGEGPGLELTPSPFATPLTMTLESPTVAPPPEAPAATDLPSPPTVTSLAPTGTPLPPTATPPPPPPRIVSFEVTRNQITAGECVTFSWRVEGAPTAIYFDGEGVTNPSSAERCLTATKEYQLRAEGPGGVDTESLTVVVVAAPSPIPDTQGPLIQNEAGPQQMWAPDGGSCRGDEPYQFQANVSDPSGVLWAKLVYSINQGPEQSGGLHLVSGTTYRLQYILPNLQGDGGTFRWHVSACDKVNPMNCSDSATHTISMLDCPA